MCDQIVIIDMATLYKTFDVVIFIRLQTMSVQNVNNFRNTF